MYAVVTAGLTHYVLCTYVSPETSSLVDEAVYPPGKGEMPPSPIEGEVVEDTKEPIAFTKEEDV